MYGSATYRTFYGAGDYNRAVTMTRGYYAAGGFFGKILGGLKKFAGVALPTISGMIPGANVLGSVLGKLPGAAGGTGLTWGAAVRGGEALSKALGGPGPQYQRPPLPGAESIARGMFPASRPGPGLSLITTAGPHGGLYPSHEPGGVGGKRRRRRRGGGRRTGTRYPSQRRRRSTRRYYGYRPRRRSHRRRGDYGDDWSGRTPSRDRSGRFLTRRGGRHHHRKRGRGRRVSFMARGRRVSFMRRRGDDDED